MEGVFSVNDLNEIERHAKALMLATGVGRLGFRFTRGTRTIAVCQGIKFVQTNTFIPHTIGLSKRWAQVLPMEEIREILIHEIAHALTPGQAQVHGVEFKRKVRELGGTATNRCFQPSVYIDGTPRESRFS